MKTFGITGSIACGKSSLSDYFRDHGVPVVDADAVGHKLLTANSKTTKAIIKAFGQDIVEDGTIVRGTLGKIVFADTSKRALLDSIVKPALSSAIKKELQLYSKFPLVGLDAALIIEWGWQSKFRPLIVVAVHKSIQLDRLMKRNKLARKDALARINAQLSQAEKLKHADYVVYNNLGKKDLRIQAEILLKELASPNLLDQMRTADGE
jgi:dephospho-CoA kinase